MSDQVTVSVIIPVYNNAKFVEDALDCLERQGLDSFEAIAVDDGSTDGSAEVLDRYAATHDWLHVIHQENQGVSAARNAALDQASGTYVGFLDSDDTYYDGALADMVLLAETRGADLVIGESRSVGEFSTTSLVNTRKLANKVCISRDDLDLIFNFSCCNKIFRRSIIEEHGLRYPKLRHAEDGVFLYSFLCHCGGITGCPRFVYHYVKHISIVAKSTLKRLDRSLFDDVIEACERIRSFTSDWSEDFKRMLLTRILRTTVINEYYRRLWTYDDEMLDVIIAKAEAYIEELGEEGWEDIKRVSVDLEPGDTLRRRKDILASPLVSVVIEPGLGERDYADLLNSLYFQTCPNFEVVAHSSYKDQTPPEYLVSNLSFSSSLASIEEILGATRGRTLQIVQEGCVYNDNSIALMTRRLRDNDCAFVTILPKLFDGTTCRALQPSQKAFTKAALRDYLKDDEKRLTFETYDTLSCNKLFSRDALIKLAGEGDFAVGELIGKAYEKLPYLRFGNVQIATIDRTPVPESAPAPKQPEPAQPLGKREKAKRLAYGTFSRLLPVNRKKVLLLSDTGDGMDGNFALIKDAAESAGYTVVHDARASRNDWLGKKRELKQCFDIATAGCIFVEDFHKDMTYLRKRRGQRICQLWHKGPSMTKFGLSKLGDASRPEACPGSGTYTHVIASSEAMRATCADAFGVELGRVRATGIPQTDALFDKAHAKVVRKDFEERYPVLRNKKLLLVAPDYRGGTPGKATYPFERIDPVTLHEALGNEWVIAFRWHPAMVSSKGKKCPYDWDAMKEYALDLTGACDLYDALMLCDALVADYSSFIFDYALLDKPIVFYWFDVNKRIISSDARLPFSDYVYGPVAYEFSELVQDLGSLKVDEGLRASFVERFMSACDGHASRKVIEWVMGR